MEQELDNKRQEMAKIRRRIESKIHQEKIKDTIDEIQRKLEEKGQEEEWQKTLHKWLSDRKTKVEKLNGTCKELNETMQKEFSDSELGEPPSLDSRSAEDVGKSFERELKEIENWLQYIQEEINTRQEKVRKETEEFKKKMEGIEKQIRTLETTINNLESESKNIDRAIGALKEEYEKYSLCTNLYKLFKVDERAGGKHPSFQQWITGFFLKQMLRNATPYLKEFTDGRLAFYTEGKTGEKETKEIEVMDFSYGKRRKVTDLSGGEKFMAALSLALGLTDLLLQFESDAERPGFLFIDEGFGTLDTERLRSVIEALRNYASKHDILLGIVSHRQELHEMVPVRIHVTHDRKTRRGSQVQIQEG